jgi:1-acyl-sn-glycerol-3-phosphate acyltransferase
VRQLFWWLGARPASRALMKKFLTEGKCVAICPGGVQECLYMEKGMNSEHVFLNKRTGFIRIGLELGVPVVPVFAFGQTDMLTWYRPGPPIVPEAALHSFSRKTGFVPLAMWGVWGTPLPKPSKLTVVIGKPIQLPKTPNPSPELVEEKLKLFISTLVKLFDEHKADAGYKDYTLKVD